jgi:hypothetical protein
MTVRQPNYRSSEKEIEKLANISREKRVEAT